MVKLDIRYWQGIFIGYQGNNQYWAYNLRTGKVDITEDIFVDKQHLYYREVLNDRYYSGNDWTKTNDVQLANVNDFRSLNTDDSSYSVGENTLKQPKKERNDSQDEKQDLTALDDLESGSSEPPERRALRNQFWQNRNLTSIKAS